jgi:hypothetical protein
VTGPEALAYITLEVGRACTQLGVADCPAVCAVTVVDRYRLSSPTAAAYIVPEGIYPASIEVLWWALWGFEKKTLQCVARHEVAHIALGHTTLSADRAEAYERHRQVQVLMAQKWKQDSRCSLGEIK